MTAGVVPTFASWLLTIAISSSALIVVEVSKWLAPWLRPR